MSYRVFPAATNPTVALCGIRVAVAFSLPPPPCLHRFLHLAATTRPVQYVIEYVCDDAWQHPQTQREHSALCSPFGHVVCRVRHGLFRSRLPVCDVHTIVRYKHLRSLIKGSRQLMVLLQTNFAPQIKD
ncbi:Piso0_000238 [Millerozyma farinosa CBS 7064]|uniref:Piso0_000238 protein n=1 Tax=Pichia sorbitophila (strain ATCC MYA-4447 / BCRC 22081 / CBS 7064 / NBRC 10061 / NRRL Y-12695) TaxID=559304 RepID=G8YUW5_PICSO|nr:Piso0_000238 [Millerozyma farinosa CBS 7064]